MKFDELKTPAYVIDEKKLIHNLEILKSVEEHTGCHILLAQKAFSSYALYPLISQYISGTTASGIFEAELGHECMGKENHVFAPAFTDEDMDKHGHIYLQAHPYLHLHLQMKIWMSL